MKVLVIGAAGYIGSAVAAALVRHGHEVTALQRTQPGDGFPYAVRLGDATDPATLRAAITDDIDAVINLAQHSGDQAVDEAATAVLLDALRGKALVSTSGVWVLGETGREAATEDAPTHAPAIVSYRPVIERQILTAEGVRGVVLRPGIVYGDGGGIPGLFVDLARKHGAGRYVGTPATRWAMVHLDDLAELYALAVESAPAGTLLHGVDEEAVSTVALAAAADVAAGGTGKADFWPQAEAAGALGKPFADALALDQAVSSAKTRELFGWTPSGRSAVATIAAG
ncbi:MAG: NAD-dependent epimerase/dehydratase family protein [Hamadaea sp.]|nr:NAD-dependent epimerase/dehydratase family protein [Hamadaea sp.]